MANIAIANDGKTYEWVCDICHRPTVGYHIDGRMAFGSWADVCESCHRDQGIGFGVGKGQRYENGVKVNG